MNNRFTRNLPDWLKAEIYAKTCTDDPTEWDIIELLFEEYVQRRKFEKELKVTLEPVKTKEEE